MELRFESQHAQVVAVVREAIREVVGPGVAGRANDGDGLVDDLGLDSLALVKLQVALEAKLNICFDPLTVDLTEVFDTVGALVRYLVAAVTDALETKGMIDTGLLPLPEPSFTHDEGEG